MQAPFSLSETGTGRARPVTQQASQQPFFRGQGSVLGATHHEAVAVGEGEAQLGREAERLVGERREHGEAARLRQRRSRAWLAFIFL
jgi:hypothetical protein